MLSEGNQIHNFISSSGSDFLTVPVPVPQGKKLRFLRFRFRFRFHNTANLSLKNVIKRSPFIEVHLKKHSSDY